MYMPSKEFWKQFSSTGRRKVFSFLRDSFVARFDRSRSLKNINASLYAATSLPNAGGRQPNWQIVISRDRNGTLINGFANSFLLILTSARS